MLRNLGRALKAAAKGFVSEIGAGQYKAGGLQVRCPHCRGVSFEEREALLNTTAASAAGVDRLNQSGTALACEYCGLIQWYAKPPERLHGQSSAE